MNLNKYILTSVIPIFSLISILNLFTNNSRLAIMEENEEGIITTNSCDFEAKILIEQSPKCGNLGGVVSVWVTGNVEPVTYFWKSDSGEMFSTGTINSLENVPANVTYWAIIRDASGCEVILDFELAEQPCDCYLTAQAIINKYPECGGANGSVQINYSGDKGDVKFDAIWGNAARRDNLTAGQYAVILTDESNCKFILNFDLTEGVCCKDFVATPVINRLPDCGKDNGSVRIDVVGQTGGVTYSWGDSNQRDNLEAGEYWVIVKDGAGCTVTVHFEIAGENCCVDSDLAATPIIQRQPECGLDNGFVEIMATGGVAPYTYSWGERASFDNLIPGNYTVIVTDAYGCTEEVSFELIREDCCSDSDLTASATINRQPECGKTNGSVTIVPNGGIAPYKYSWGEIARFDNLIPGNYFVTVTDAYGCTAAINFDLIQEDCCKDSDLVVIPIIGKHPECGKSNGAVRLEVTGGVAPFAYSWGGQSSFDNLIPGTYSVTVTDAYGCTNMANFELVEGPCCPNFLVEFMIQDPTVCEQNDGTVNFLITETTNNLTYSWDDGLVTTDSFRTNLTNRTYEVTITDDLVGCQQIIKIPLKTFAPCCDLVAVLGDTIHPTCDTPFATASIEVIRATNPITITWNGEEGELTMTNLTDPSYQVIITEANTNCADTLNFEFPQPENCPCELEVILGDTIHPTCEIPFGAANIEVSGAKNPISITWNGVEGPANRKDLDTASYVVIVSEDVTNCTDTLFLEFPQLGDCCTLNADYEVLQMPDCKMDNGIVAITYTGAISTTLEYIWEDTIVKDSIRIGLMAGDYQVIIREDSTNCADTIIVNLMPPNPPELTIFPDTLCADTTIGGVGYELIGCFEFPIAIQILDSMGGVVRVVERDTLGIGRIEALSSDQVYIFLVMNEFGEEMARQIFRILIPPKPNYQLFQDTILCDINNITEIRVEPSEMISFTWLPNLNIPEDMRKEQVLNVPFGTYFIELNNGCPTLDSVTIRDGSIKIDPIKSDTLCMEGITILSINNLESEQDLTYDWRPKSLINASIDTTATISVEVKETTQFNVNISNQFGCTLSDSVTIIVADTNLLTNIRVLPEPEKIPASGSSNLSLTELLPEGFRVEWQEDNTLEDNMDGTAIVFPTENGTNYAATISSEIAPQCSVIRDTAIWIGCDDDAVFIPNAFSPNSDGVNDILFVRGADGFESMNLIVYNRWGEKVFETSNPDIGWDGRYKGKELGPDVFGYYLTVTCPSDIINLKGNVTLLK